MKFERKNIDLQIEKLKLQDSPDSIRLQELKSRSDIVDEATLIFASYSDRYEQVLHKNIFLFGGILNMIATLFIIGTYGRSILLWGDTALSYCTW